MSFTSDNANLESAMEIIASYRGFLNTDIRNEKKRPHPDTLKLDALNTQLATLRTEYAQLSINNLPLVGKARFVYGPLVKARNKLAHG